jgi:structure-specific recognition protein 1
MIILSFADLISEFRVAASGMGWKGVDTEGRTLLSSENIKWAQWFRVARNFQLRVGMKDRKKFVFDGFLREVSPRLRHHHR